MPVQDLTGQQISNYRLTQLLGQGGFARVYLGTQVYLQTKTAIKVLNDTDLSDADRAGFTGEARAISQLSHPNIVKLLDFGIEGNRHGNDGSIPYLIMEYAPGGTLRKRHPRGSRVPLDRIAFYVEKVANALDYAHSKQVLHRDVKPENMLVAPGDDIWLSDFGIAVTNHDSNNPPVIINGVVQGTAAYIAPERFQNRNSRASDQYSLGVVVYEWLMGNHPFTGTQNQIINQHIYTPPPPLCDEKHPEITQEIEAVVLRALAKLPEQRYPSVKEFAQALIPALQKVSNAPAQDRAYQQGYQGGTAAPGENAPRQPLPWFTTEPPQQQQQMQQLQPQRQQMQQPPPQQQMQQPPPQQPVIQGGQQQLRPQSPLPQPPPLRPQPPQQPIVLGGDGSENSYTFRSPLPNLTVAEQAPILWRQLRAWFELDPEFDRMAKNRSFRQRGMLLNIFAAVLLGLMFQPISFVAMFLGAVYVLGMFKLCIRLVNRKLSMCAGMLVALFWGYLGIMMGNRLSSAFPPLGVFVPALLLGLIFLAISVGLHWHYVENRL